MYVKGTLSDFGYRYLLANPAIKSRYTTPAHFIQNYEPDLASWNLLRSLASKDSITIDKLTDNEKNLLKNLLNHLLPGNSFGMKVILRP